MLKKASDILASYWDGKLPVDLARIGAGMGVSLFGSSHLGPLSGKIELVEGRPHVTVNTSEEFIRQRFTLAHELGHYALGHLSDGQTILRDPAAHFSTGSLPLVEREANAFAAELLMPRKVVEFAVNVKRMLDVGELASIFGVSQAAMTYRLHNLGLISSVIEFN